MTTIDFISSDIFDTLSSCTAHDRKRTYREQCCEFVLRLGPLSLLPDHITDILVKTNQWTEGCSIYTN